MKRFLNKRVIILVWVAVFVLCIPSSLAKYYKTDTLEYSVKYHYSPDPAIVYKTNAVKTNDNNAYVQTPSDVQTVTIEKDGYYQIIAKGGDGGAGFTADGSTIKGSSILGGTGGLVSVKVKLSKGDVLKMFVGHKGGDGYMTNGLGQSGYAGTTKTSFGQGGKGNNGDDFRTQTMVSFNIGSGGGGAATSVYLNDSSTYNKNLICIAAGGGGGGCWNCGWRYPTGMFTSVPAGFGGSGGSNVINTPSPVSGATNIYAGVDGHLGSYLTAEGDYQGKNPNEYVAGERDDVDTFGGGGTDVGGAAAGTYHYPFIVLSITSYGHEGTGFSSSGGKGANSSSYAGAGGGGYCGGGSGSGASLIYSAGGGGGGSSYIMNDTSLVTSYNDINAVKATLEEAAGLSIEQETHYPKFLIDKSHSLVYEETNWYGGKTGKIITNYTDGTPYSIDRVYNGNNLQSEGFVIVKYLGPIT